MVLPPHTAHAATVSAEACAASKRPASKIRDRLTESAGWQTCPMICHGPDVPHRGTHKGHHCQEGVRIWPGDYARRRAGLTVLLDPSPQLAGSSRRAARGQAGAPAAAQRRGRTSLTPAGGGRSWRARKGSLRIGLSGRVRVPGAWRAEWSRKHPSGAAWCGRLP